MYFGRGSPLLFHTAKYLLLHWRKGTVALCLKRLGAWNLGLCRQRLERTPALRGIVFVEHVFYCGQEMMDNAVA